MKFLHLILAALLLAAIPHAQAADYNRASFTQSLQSFTPTTGQTISLTRAYDVRAFITPAAALAALTVNFPTAPKDGDTVTIFSTQNITALTLTNGTISHPNLKISQGSSISYVFSSSNGNIWFQSSGIGGAGGLDKIVSASGSTTGALTRLSSGFYSLAASACDLFNGASACASAFGYADPRWFGAYCGSSFTTNNNTQDDAPGIQSALNSGYPVKIPEPGCKVSSRVNFTDDGQTIFSEGSGGAYGSNFPGHPYIFIPNSLYEASSTDNCAFNTSGYDDVGFRNITFRGNFDLRGAVAMCNTVGVRSPRSAAFLNIDNVSCLNLGACIGASMVSSADINPGDSPNLWGSATPCTPTGTLMNPVFQVRGSGLNMIGTCMGMYGNFSDMHLSDIYAANVRHNVISSTGTFGQAWDMNNMRIEYSGRGGGGGQIYQNGTGIYVGGRAANIANLVCDHQYGSCVSFGPGSRSNNLTNIVALDSMYGDDADYEADCHFQLMGTSALMATNVSTYRGSVDTPYVVCDQGATQANNYITWNASRGDLSSSSGFTTSYFNLTYGTPPTYMNTNIPGLENKWTGTPINLDGITQYKENVYNIGNSGSAVTLSLANGSFQRVTLTAPATFTMPTPIAGKSILLAVYTGAGGNTADFPGVRWTSSSQPIITPAASKVDFITFTSPDGSGWFGNYAQNYPQ